VSKIQSQAGQSLADVYDVVGSVAGIEELIPKEVTLTHDMASTIFSERMSSLIIGNSTGAIAQTLPIDTAILNLPNTPFRIHGITLMNAATNTVARIANMVVVLTDPGGNDIIIWMWDGTVEIQRLEADVKEILMPEPGFDLPNLGMGGGQPSTVPQMFMRGDTITFGAGTVNIEARVHISFSQLEGVSSVGLPIPSW